MKHRGHAVATQADVRALIDGLEALREERDAAATGMREALVIVERAASLLEEIPWDDANDPHMIVRRAFTMLVNAPEMVRACVVASIPREPLAAAPSPSAEQGARERDGNAALWAAIIGSLMQELGRERVMRRTFTLRAAPLAVLRDLGCVDGMEITLGDETLSQWMKRHPASHKDTP